MTEAVKPWRRFTPEEKECIRSGFADYVDVRVIAAKLGRDVGTVRQIINTMGLRRDRTVFKMMKWCPEHLKPMLKEKGSAAFIEAVNSHSEKLEQAEISNDAMISAEERSVIDAQIAAIEARPELERREKMAAMRSIGLSLKEISERFGITRERVRQLTDPDFVRPQQRTGSFDNLLAANARLEKKIEENKLRIRAELLNKLTALWRSADEDIRKEFLEAVKTGKLQ
jgi:hypothetical protein